MTEPRRVHETSDVDVRLIVRLGIGLFAAVGIIVAVTNLAVGRLARRPDPTRALRSPLASNAPAPEPRLQTTPPVDMKALTEREAHILSTYGWVDRQQAIVRIPIERAKELILERGLPARSAP